jgi:AbrB family looped-hinge helix DNA binding protein
MIEPAAHPISTRWTIRLSMFPPDGLTRATIIDTPYRDSSTPYHSSGSIDAMRTTIDKAGRLVIPRSIRDRIGLAGGGEVELELDGAAVRIEAIAGSDFREEGGRLVIPASGAALTNAAVRELIDADRHGR